MILSNKQFKKNVSKKDNNVFETSYSTFTNKIVINNNYTKSNYLDCVDKSLKDYNENHIKEYDMKIRQIIDEYKGIKCQTDLPSAFNLKRKNEKDVKTIKNETQRKTIVSRFQNKKELIQKQKKNLLENIKLDIKEIIINIQKIIDNFNNKKEFKKEISLNLNDHNTLLKGLKTNNFNNNQLTTLISHYNNKDKYEFFREDLIEEHLNITKSKIDISKILNWVTEEKLEELLKLNYSYKDIKDKFRKIIVRELMNIEERERVIKIKNLETKVCNNKIENSLIINDLLN